MSILPGNKAPWFSSIGFQENKFMDISINDYTGKWLVLFFYPLDFGYVSPSELLELEARRPELESLNCRYTINLISNMVFNSSSSPAPGCWLCPKTAWWCTSVLPI